VRRGGRDEERRGRRGRRGRSTLSDDLSLAATNGEPVDLRRASTGTLVLYDPELRLAAALELPTFEVEGARLYERLTLVARAGVIVKVFYPVFPPDRNADEVIAWLAAGR
jgi:hypothetical protein